MPDSSNFHTKDDETEAPHVLTEQELNEVLDESEADIAAGRVSPWSEVRVRLLSVLAEAEAEQAKRRV